MIEVKDVNLTIKPNVQTPFKIVVRNLSDKEVTIIPSTIGCSCTVLDLAEKKILPLGILEIDATIQRTVGATFNPSIILVESETSRVSYPYKVNVQIDGQK